MYCRQIWDDIPLSGGPHVGSGVVRIDLLHFLARYLKTQLNQVLS